MEKPQNTTKLGFGGWGGDSERMGKLGRRKDRVFRRRGWKGERRAGEGASFF